MIGVAFYVALLVSIYPSIRHSAHSLQGYINSLPAAFRAAFLGPGGDFSSPVGYVNTELLSWLAPIALIAFAISVAARFAGRRGGERHAQPAAHAHGRPAAASCCRSTPPWPDRSGHPWRRLLAGSLRGHAHRRHAGRRAASSPKRYCV